MPAELLTCGTGREHSSPQGTASWQLLQHSLAVCSACRAQLSSHRTCMQARAAASAYIARITLGHCCHSFLRAWPGCKYSCKKLGCSDWEAGAGQRLHPSWMPEAGALISAHVWHATRQSRAPLAEDVEATLSAPVAGHHAHGHAQVIELVAPDYGHQAACFGLPDSWRLPGLLYQLPPGPTKHVHLQMAGNAIVEAADTSKLTGRGHHTVCLGLTTAGTS